MNPTSVPVAINYKWVNSEAANDPQYSAESDMDEYYHVYKTVKECNVAHSFAFDHSQVAALTDMFHKLLAK